MYVFRVQKRLIMIDQTFVMLASISSAPGRGISGNIMAGEWLFKFHQLRPFLIALKSLETKNLSSSIFFWHKDWSRIPKKVL